MAADKHFARMIFDYAGEQLDRGQILELKGAINDEKLVRLGYVGKLAKADPVSHCGACQKQFRGDDMRDAHAKLRHSGREVTPEMIEQEQERAQKQTPLHLDKTKASKRAGL